MADPPKDFKVYCIYNKDTFEVYSIFKYREDALNSKDNCLIEYDKNPTEYNIRKITGQVRITDFVYVVRISNNGFPYVAFSKDEAERYYDAKLCNLKLNQSITLYKYFVYDHCTGDESPHININSSGCDKKESSVIMIEESSLYISAFVKDLNFNLAKILIVRAIIPDSGRVDYELGTIETSTDSPIIEFRFVLDKVNNETEPEFKERCFEKMRDMLIQRTKGKL
jgi:hypothetical protein